MKLFINIFSLLFILLFTTSCEDILGTKGESFKGISFLGGGYYEVNSARNHEYRFDIEENNATITVEAQFKRGNGRIYILNSARSIAYSSNIETDILLEDLVFDFSGVYYLVVTSELEDINEYDLEVSGDANNFTRINNEEKRFNDQTWAQGGGVYNYNSFRNLQFKFTIDEDNTYLDFTAYSQGPNLRMYVLNSARNITHSSNITTVAHGIAWFFDQSGEYYLVIATDQNFSDEKVDLAITSNEGTLSNIQQIPPSTFSSNCNNNMQGGGIYEFESTQNDRYNLLVNEPTFIDVSSKASQNIRLYLRDNAGSILTSSNIGLSPELNSVSLNPGTYSLVITCDSNTDYCIDLWSQAGTVEALN